MHRERKESGLSVRAWCQEHGISEHVYYYRLRKLRQAACLALEQAQPVQLAEVPLAPKEPECQSQIRLTTNTGTLEIMEADRKMKTSMDEPERILEMLVAELAAEARND